MGRKIGSIKWTSRLDELVGAVAFPRDFHLQFESDTLAYGVINGRNVEVNRVRKGKFLVRVDNLPSITLTGEADTNHFLAVVAGYDH